MSTKRFPPNDPREWLNRAQSNLSQAERGIRFPHVYLEDLCFHAQQAAEKSIKAVLIYGGIRFPYTHDLAKLFTLLEQNNCVVPQNVRESTWLSDYATVTRYPGPSEPVGQREYKKAVTTAKAVLRWAETVIKGQTTLSATPSRRRKKKTKS